MSKLEPALQQALVAWRVQSGEGSPDKSRSPEQKHISAKRVTVDVTYEGDIAALQTTGIGIFHRSDLGGRTPRDCRSRVSHRRPVARELIGAGGLEGGVQCQT